MRDITNQRFGRLTVIRPVGQTVQKCWIWECRCDCGKIKNITSAHIVNGSTKSCGCFKAENLKLREGKLHHCWAGYKEISKTFYMRMVTAAKQRGWEWELTIEYLWELFLNQNRKCAMTGIEMVMPIHLRQLTKRNQITASLDRIDPTKGYVIGNVQWVCKRVNYMKHVLTQELFLDWVKKIYEHSIAGR